MSYKKKYQSLMGAKGLITAPNYLAELIILKRANKKGINLPHRIWDKQFKGSEYKYWHNSYFGELVYASAILEQFDEDCVIEAFNHNECELILSLKNEKLYRISKEIQDKKTLLLATKEKIDLVIANPNSITKRVGVSKTKMSKLK